MSIDTIHVKGARVHNLKNIEVSIPRNKLVVITGLSGSGKSSLAFDTIYAEGQRRYVESLSAYARQFLEQMDKPDVDHIAGLSPAISIDQKSRSKNPRSTVGTVTEVYDYFRLLFAHIGKPHCPHCGKPVQKQSVQEIADTIMKKPSGTKLLVLAPLVRGRKGEYTKLFEDLLKKGFTRVRVDGEIYPLNEKIPLKKNIKHTIEVVVDRLSLDQENYKRLFESLETALKEGEHIVEIATLDDKSKVISSQLFSELFTCLECNISIPEILPRTFSFNTPYGACEECKGLGVKYEFDPAKVIPDPKLSLREGAIAPWGKQMEGFMGQMIGSLSKQYKFSLDSPFQKLPENIQNILLYGTEQKINYSLTSRSKGAHYEWQGKFEGVIPNLDRLYMQTESEWRKEDMEKYMTVRPCQSCHGKKLNPIALAVTIQGKTLWT